MPAKKCKEFVCLFVCLIQSENSTPVPNKRTATRPKNGCTGVIEVEQLDFVASLIQLIKLNHLINN